MWIFIILSLAVIALTLLLDAKKPKNFPPGPDWHPILGSCLAVKNARSQYGYFTLVAEKLGKRFSKNGVLGLRVGKDRIVITNDLPSSKEMLHNDDIDGRPKGLFYETRTWGERRGIVLTDTDLWREQRKFIMKHLREFGYNGRGLWGIVQNEAEHLLMDLKQKCSENNNDAAVVPMTELFGIYILNTLWYMMAGRRYSSDDAELKVLQDLLFELFANIDMIGAMFSHFPVLKYVAPEWSGYNRFLHIHQRIWKFLRHELDNHQKTFQPENENRDFMDAYIRKMQSPDTGKYFTDSQLLAICMDLFMAGTETTNKSMGFMFLNLVRNPDIQAKARQEIDTVIGRDRLPSVEDRAKMPYIEACVLEGIRHFMGRTFGIPHRALKDTSLGGYFVPKDATVLTNFGGIMLNDEYFKDAMSFRPERFIVGGKVEVPEEYIPFGLGKHRCMGELLARTNMFMYTVTTLQSFELREVPGEVLPDDSSYIDGATPSVKPYKALLMARKK